jgi:hypothetical protein
LPEPAFERRGQHELFLACPSCFSTSSGGETVSERKLKAIVELFNWYGNENSLATEKANLGTIIAWTDWLGKMIYGLENHKNIIKTFNAYSEK